MTIEINTIADGTAIVSGKALRGLNDRLRAHLNGETDAMDAADVELVAHLLVTSLAFRDAFIVYALAPHEVSARDMVLFETRAFEREASERMGVVMNGRFTDGTPLDARVLDRARDLMDAVADTAGDDFKCVAQTCAVSAYLCWWQGETDEAATHALKAVALDENCTLAGLVLAAVVRNVTRPTA